MYVVAIPMPDDQKQDVLNAFSSTFAYQPLVTDPNDPMGPLIANPLTIDQFLENCVGDYIMGVTASYLVNLAAAAAAANAQSAAQAAAAVSKEFFDNLRQARADAGSPLFGGNNLPDVAASSIEEDTAKSLSFSLPSDDPNYKEKAVAWMEHLETKANEEPSTDGTSSKTKRPKKN
jgi:hypothetical protein